MKRNKAKIVLIKLSHTRKSEDFLPIVTQKFLKCFSKIRTCTLKAIAFKIKNIYSKSGLVGVLQMALLLCGDTVLDITRSAGTEILLENSVAADEVFARDFRCLLK